MKIFLLLEFCFKLCVLMIFGLSLDSELRKNVSFFEFISRVLLEIAITLFLSWKAEVFRNSFILMLLIWNSHGVFV